MGLSGALALKSWFFIRSAIAKPTGGSSAGGWASRPPNSWLGASVVICGRTPEKLNRVVAFTASKGARMVAVQANVREPEQVAGVVRLVNRLEVRQRVWEHETDEIGAATA